MEPILAGPFPNADNTKRFVKRLGTSLPQRAEKLVGAALESRDAGFLRANEARANPPIDLYNIPEEPYGEKIDQRTVKPAAFGTRKRPPSVHFDMSKL